MTADGGELLPGATPPRPTGHRALRWAIGTLLAFVVFAGAAVWNAHRLADDTFARHRRIYDEEIIALSARPRGRPAILEPAVAGNAEGVLDAYLSAVAAVPDTERSRLAFLFSRSKSSSPEEQDRVLAAHPEPLAALGPLLHVPRSSSPMRIDDGGPILSKGLPRVMDGARWIHAAALRGIARADAASVLRIIGDEAALGADVMSTGAIVPWLYGLSFENAALGNLRKTMSAAPLPADGLARLANTLDGLDASRPSLVEVCDTERALVRGFLIGSGPRRSVLDENTQREIGWRYLWSERLATAAALREWDAIYDRLRVLMSSVRGGDIGGGALDRRRAISEAGHIPEAADNPVITSCLPNWGYILSKDGDLLATWRVARVSIAVALHVAKKKSLPASLADLVPAYLSAVPIDPWDGKPIRYAMTATGATIWSVGPDGKDDGGTPYADPDRTDGPGDIAWTVPSPK
jgi:hypothetical protein